MKTLTIRTSFLRFFHRSHTVTIPESYEEMTPSQFIAVVALSNQLITEEAFFLRFLGIKSSILAQLDPWHLYTITAQLDFLKKIKQGISRILIPSLPLFPKVSLSVFHVSGGSASAILRKLWFCLRQLSLSFSVSGGSAFALLAPTDKLQSMTFQHFMTVDTFFSWYLYTNRDIYLRHFVAALYMQPHEDFQNHDIALTSKLIFQGRPREKELCEAIACNWALIREWLSASYPFLFPAFSVSGGSASAPSSPQASAEPSPKKQRPGSWLEIFDSLVGDDLTRILSYQTLPAIDVIRIINRKIKEQKTKK